MVGDGDGLSKSSVCRIVRACLDKVATYLDDVVRFPRGDALSGTKKKFFLVAGKSAIYFLYFKLFNIHVAYYL
jgi:hypothetical protein